MLKDKRDEVVQKRIERMRRRGRRNWSIAKIADHEGLPADEVRKELRKAGIRVPKDPKGYVPIKCTEPDVVRLSAFLATHLSTIRTEAGEDYYEVAQKTGIGRNAQTGVLTNSKIAHNWTLSQIARLAEARNMTLFELLEDVLVKANKEKSQLPKLK